MNTQIQKLEQLHQLLNNEVNGPKLMAFLKKHNITGPEDLEKNIEESFGIAAFSTDYWFLHLCILCGDCTAFLYEENEEGTNESDWERFTEQILNKIN